MYFRDDIIITRKGLRIRAKALHPVGIADESVCWAIAVPPAPHEPSRTPDLVLSAFHPSSWHILLRLTIELTDKRGTLLKVMKLINDGERHFNILSTQCAPSGYKHATWNIIGEALDERIAIEKSLVEVIKDCYRDVDAFSEVNSQFRNELTRHVSGRMLNYTNSLERNLRDVAANSENSEYLLKRINQEDTLLYNFASDTSWFEAADSTNKSEEFERFKKTLPQQISVKWLQQLATYRIYNQVQTDGKFKREQDLDPRPYLTATWANPLRFTYDATHSFLEPHSEGDRLKYEKLIGACLTKDEVDEGSGLPIRAVAAFSPDEHYLRVSLPDKEKKNRRLHIRVDYRVHLNKEAPDPDHKNTSSIGLLEELAEKISSDRDGIDLRYIENSVLNYSKTVERGRITIVGTSEQSVTDATKQRIREDIQELQNLRRQNVEFVQSHVNRYGAKTIFLSTRFEFIERTKRSFRNALIDLVRGYGFMELVAGDGQITRHFTDRDNHGHNLEQSISQRIIACDAFLQIYPRISDESGLADRDRDWLLFELGLARGCGIPYEICVDEKYAKDYPNRIIEGKESHRFNSFQDTIEIMSSIEAAVKALADACY